MQYRVIRFFTDLQDNGFAYNVGDKFPRDGKAVTVMSCGSASSPIYFQQPTYANLSS